MRVGTRGSKLALTQTTQFVQALQAAHPGLTVETVIIRTTGDVRQNIPFTEVGTKGMFVKEIEEALLGGRIDFAVHSLKDMPVELPSGLTLTATPPRVDARDALISRGRTLADLPAGALLGTSSLRRQAQMRSARPDLRLEELRGNLDTRLRKLDEGQYDAIVLACAGLERLGMADRIAQRLPIETSIPAPGQGILAVECREDALDVRELLAALNDPAAHDAATAERGFQAALDAGCTVPAGAYAAAQGDRIRLLAMVAAPDGSALVRTQVDGARLDARSLGEQAARELIAQGGKALLGR